MWSLKSLQSKAHWRMLGSQQASQWHRTDQPLLACNSHFRPHLATDRPQTVPRPPHELSSSTDQSSWAQLHVAAIDITHTPSIRSQDEQPRSSGRPSSIGGAQAGPRPAVLASLSDSDICPCNTISGTGTSTCPHMAVEQEELIMIPSHGGI